MIMNRTKDSEFVATFCFYLTANIVTFLQMIFPGELTTFACHGCRRTCRTCSSTNSPSAWSLGQRSKVYGRNHTHLTLRHSQSTNLKGYKIPSSSYFHNWRRWSGGRFCWICSASQRAVNHVVSRSCSSSSGQQVCLSSSRPHGCREVVLRADIGKRRVWSLCQPQ